MVREGNRNCRSFLPFFPPSQPCPYLVYGRKDAGALRRTDVTDKPFLGCGSSIVLRSLLLLPSGYSRRRFVSSIFRKRVQSRRVLPGLPELPHQCGGVRRHTELSAVVKEERMSGMTLHTAVAKPLVSPHGESCSRAAVQKLTASCKLRMKHSEASFPLPVYQLCDTQHCSP